MYKKTYFYFFYTILSDSNHKITPVNNLNPTKKTFFFFCFLSFFLTFFHIF